MSMDYYNSLMETIHLTRSPANAAHLNKSIAQYSVGQTTEKICLNESNARMD
jgi:antitoxin YefM